MGEEDGDEANTDAVAVFSAMTVVCAGVSVSGKLSLYLHSGILLGRMMKDRWGRDKRVQRRQNLQSDHWRHPRSYSSR